MRRTALHERLVVRAEDYGVKLLWRRPAVAIGAGHVELASDRIHVVGSSARTDKARGCGAGEESKRNRFGNATRPGITFVFSHGRATSKFTGAHTRKLT